MLQTKTYQNKQEALNELDQYKDAVLYESARKALLSDDEFDLSEFVYYQSIYPSSVEESYAIRGIARTYLIENTSVNVAQHHSILDMLEEM